ncbi:unnamed protein product [Camellia sinensis]
MLSPCIFDRERVMAHILLSALVNTILSNLNSLALRELGIARGLKSELDNLESTLSTIQSVLQDAEAKQRKSLAVNNWLRKLKDAAYDADNLIDEIVTEGLRRKLDSQRGCKSKVSRMTNCLLFRLKMGHKIMDMKNKLDAIASERSKFHLREIVVETEVHEVERGQTCSLVNESEIYGRNHEKEEIIELLIGNLSCDDDVSVYAICGMGGLGKTTLAQLVYNDGRVKRHFELRIWVCVSDDFNVERLIRAILESVQGHGCDISNLDPLLLRLQEKLGGRRFLLVLDDVWNECHEKWDGLKQALRCGAKGSIIIVTTRIQKVALIMATILPIHHLAYLSEDHSWSLFKLRAFGNRGRELELELIGKDIVKKCGGLPLAIKALGSLMQFKRSESEWLSVKESKILDLSDGGNAILPALRLSYEALPPHLRQCFAYCCIFPKDYTMKKDVLIEMWMANGFIPSRGQTTLYDMGHQIFDQLVWRSFLQDVTEEQGETTCKMHDLMHDLAESIMRHECFIMDSRKGLKLPKKVRHLSFNVSSTPMIHCNEVMFKVPSLRSCILLSNQYSYKDNDFSWISKQKYLRLLDLSGKIDEKVAVSISNFKHLRFLNMSYSYIKILPESISGLQHLQTLKLNYCEELCKLPKRLKYMRNLTCLDIKGCDSLTSMPANMGQLTCLQRLSIFIVGQDEGYQISELKELNLGGELSIKELENVRNSEDAKRANLKRKLDLISLNLCWSDSNKESIPKNVEEILENLRPNSNLKKLSISFYQGSRFPNWMSGLVLKNVVEISLESCRCERLPPLGKLTSLKILKICSMDSLKYFNHESYGDGEDSFPALEILSLNVMPSLEKWTIVDRKEIFPCLRNLHIEACPKLTEFPFLRTLEILTIWEGSNERLIRSVINVTSLSDLEILGSELKILPDELFQSHKDLESLRLISLYNLKTLPNQLDCLSSLKLLNLDYCPQLENLSGLKNLNHLETLYISECDSLTSLPVQGLQGLTSLRSLSIQNCKKLYLSDGMRYLTVLRDLLINGCPEIHDFPMDMQHLSALRDLEIWNCQGLLYLPNWLGSLWSLSYLEIENCHNLKCLPCELRGLKTLKRIKIGGCPHLERRCKKETGEDWLKIVHIPIIEINGELVQSLDC